MARAFAIIMRFIVASIVMRLILFTTRNGKRSIEKVVNADARDTNLTNVTAILSRATSRVVSADTERLALVTELGNVSVTFVAVGAFFVPGAWLGTYAHGDRSTSTIQTDLPWVTSFSLGSAECWVVPKLDGCAHVVETHFTSLTLAGSATIQGIGDDVDGVTGSALAPLARGTSSLRITAFFVVSVADL
ncbi:unnamed protein product [Clonostachys rhizophaga]|uniref:Uncharacterized protein n=1 Tax=Clonostachys rhizophaga TaxID=160324 RepID=A0A9N9YGA9_9HYPO|nr:unnamed protein product [Clonostachys rhizophaga]